MSNTLKPSAARAIAVVMGDADDVPSLAPKQLALSKNNLVSFKGLDGEMHTLSTDTEDHRVSNAMSRDANDKAWSDFGAMLRWWQNVTKNNATQTQLSKQQIAEIDSIIADIQLKLGKYDEEIGDMKKEHVEVVNELIYVRLRLALLDAASKTGFEGSVIGVEVFDDPAEFTLTSGYYNAEKKCIELL